MRFQTKTLQPSMAVRSSLLACAVAVALALCALCAPAAFADQTSVQTATVTPSYANPETGQIEDSGGSDNADLGQSMTESATVTSALVEVDQTGTTYVTLRLNLMNEISKVTVEDEVNGAFKATEATEMETQATSDGDTSGDWRFAVNKYSDLLRISLYVDPMGRSVTYFVTLSDLTEGNTQDFVTTVTPGVTIEGTEAPAASADSSSASSDDSNESATPSADASDSSNDSSADSGVKEYNAEGDQVQDDGSSNRVPVLPVAIGICVVVVVIIAICFAKNRSKRQAANQAAAAAAATAAQPKANSADASKKSDK